MPIPSMKKEIVKYIGAIFQKETNNWHHMTKTNLCKKWLIFWDDLTM